MARSQLKRVVTSLRDLAFSNGRATAGRPFLVLRASRAQSTISESSTTRWPMSVTSSGGAGLGVTISTAAAQRAPRHRVVDEGVQCEPP